MGWDSITIDIQHGQNDYQSSIAMLQALSNSQSIPFVRVPWNESGIIMKMLDLGVMRIIATIINKKKIAIILYLIANIHLVVKEVLDH